MLKHLQRSILQNNRFTYELSPGISMLSLPHCFVNSENKTKKKKEISVTSSRNKRSSQVNSENKSKRKSNVLFLCVTYEILTFEVTRCSSLTTTTKAVKTFTGKKCLIGRRATTWHCQIQNGGNTSIVCLFQWKED